jgi:hypothetical protein
MNNLTNLVAQSEEKEGGLMLIDENEETNAASVGGDEDLEDGDSMLDEEGEDELDEKDGIKGDYGDEEGLFEKDEDHSDVEEFMQDMEEDEMMMDDLKMPHDLEGEDDDDDEEEGEDEMEEGENQEDGDGDVDQVFEDAAEHGEMDIIKELKKQKAEE